MEGIVLMDGSLIGLISDTHDHRFNISKAVEEFNRFECSLVIHAGDFVAPFAVGEFEGLKCPLAGVFGNNDGELKGLTKQVSIIGTIAKPPLLLKHHDRSIVVMHEPWYLDKFLGRKDVDLIVYGHTHRVEVREGHPLVVNPGEACGWVTGRATIAILELENMDVEIIDL